MSNYSGKFVLRIQVDMHKALAEEAKSKGISLNQVCISILKIGLSKNKEKPLFLNH